MTISYRTARRRVAEAAEGALSNFRDYRTENKTDGGQEQRRHLLAYIVAPPVCSAALFAISLLLSIDTSTYSVTLSTMMILLSIGVVINVFIVLRLEKTEREEVGKEIEVLVADYENYISLEDAKLGGREAGGDISKTLDHEENGIFVSTSNLASILSEGNDSKTAKEFEFNDQAGIISGHSHISIVTTYRNKSWQRIPTLLLAEGDVVALMGGDLTPGIVYELLPCGTPPSPSADASTVLSTSMDSSGAGAEIKAVLSSSSLLNGSIGSSGSASANASASASASGVRSSRDSGEILTDLRSSSQSVSISGDGDGLKNGGGTPRMWRRGRLWDRGVRVPLRTVDGTGEPSHGYPHPHGSAHSQERQRSIAPDSVELLLHSGDLRCFQLAETPISGFIRDIYLPAEGDASGDRPGAAHPRQQQHAGINQGMTIFPLHNWCAVKAEAPFFGLFSPVQPYGSNLDGVSVGAAGVKVEKHAQSSVLRSLTRHLLRRSLELLILEVVAFLVLAVVRMRVLMHVYGATDSEGYGENGELSSRWAEAVLTPVAVMVMVISPVSLPLIVLLVDSALTADVLTTIELILQGEEDKGGEQEGGKGRGGAFSDRDRDSGGGGSAGAVAYDPSKARGDPLGGGAEDDANANKNASGDDFSDDSNFDDDDIDEKIEAETREDRANTSLLRLGVYVWHVLRSRLGLGLGLGAVGGDDDAVGDAEGGLYWLRDGAQPSSSSSPSLSSADPHRSLRLLPVPLVRTRLLEVLGTVTMVCFIDDDIVCEGYSVTEEVFLLKPAAEDDVTSAGAGTSGTGAGAVEGTITSSSSSNANIANTAGSRSRGLVLDLHANPDAKGTRFENPLWWQYLPSLKPVGLSALLTYRASEVPHATTGDDAVLDVTDRDSRGDGPGRVSPVPVPLLSSPSPSGAAPVGTIPPTTGTGTGTGTDSAMERQLVRHIRRAIPLEAMRELAEEIGFCEADAAGYTRLIETNIVAPALSDRKLIVDAHSWGQEETRRRGTLTSAARGVVVTTGPLGNTPASVSTAATATATATATAATTTPTPAQARLQMMTQGDPSLILSYSREFWDGKSITPLTPADRMEVLSVFERWALEDFDVVALSYCPISTSLYQPIVQLRASASQTGPDSTHYTQGGSSPSSLFYLDPRTYSQLNGLKGRGRGRDRVRDRGMDRVGKHRALSSGPRAAAAAASSDDAGARTKGTSVDDDGDDDGAGAGAGAGDDDGAGAGAGAGGVTSTAATDFSPELALRHGSGDLDSRPVLVAPQQAQAQAQAQAQGQTAPQAQAQAEAEGEALSETGTDTASQSPSHSHAFSTSPNSPQLSQLPSEASQLDALGLALGPLAGTSSSVEDVASLASNTSVSTPPPDHSGSSIVNPSGIHINPGAGDAALYSLPPLHTTLSLDTGLQSSKLEGLQRQYASHRAFPPSPSELQTELDWTMQGRVGTVTDSTGGGGDGGGDGYGDGDGGDGDDDGDGDGDDGGDGGSGGDGSTGGSQRKGAGPSTRIPSSSSSPPPPPATSKVTTAAIQAHELAQAQAQAQAQEQQHKKRGNGSSSSSMVGAAMKAARRLTRTVASGLWPLVKQQIFLGMTASSVPVRQEVPSLMEDLTAAGVRFMYFSPRNMRRSKPVAEKIGITFDWNCAVSLRPLSRRMKKRMRRGEEPAEEEEEEEEEEHARSGSGSGSDKEEDEDEDEDEDGEPLRDPHRHISNYADWVVHAQMPHGVVDIAKHLREVDNVPLLVNLYTDATPPATRQMLELFKCYGEVVLAVGSGYRADNNSIFRAADLAVVVSLLPGDAGPLRIHGDSVLEAFPCFAPRSLTRADLRFALGIVGAGAATSPLVQTPVTRAGCLGTGTGTGTGSGTGTDPGPGPGTGARLPPSEAQAQAQAQAQVEEALGHIVPTHHSAGPRLRLAALLEAIRKGRVLLCNAQQALATTCLALLCLSLWPLVSLTLPVAVAPSLPAPLAALFIFVYLPLMLFINLSAPAPEAVLKTTPKKGILNFDRDTEGRFMGYLAVRGGWVLLSVLLTGWATAASIHDQYDSATGQRTASPWQDSMTGFISGSLSSDQEWAAVHHPDQATSSSSSSSDSGSGSVGDTNGRSHLFCLWTVQDLMSAQLVVSLLAQQATLLRRGQGHRLPHILSLALCMPLAALSRLAEWIADCLDPKIETADGQQASWWQYTCAVLSECGAGLASAMCCCGQCLVPSRTSQGATDGNDNGDKGSEDHSEGAGTGSPSPLLRGVRALRDHAHSIAAAMAIICTHGVVLFVRMWLRTASEWSDADSGQAQAGGSGLSVMSALELPVWLSLVLLPLVGVLIGVLVNIDDYAYYQQALTFQRLDFDTKLGMHSPR